MSPKELLIKLSRENQWVSIMIASAYVDQRSTKVLRTLLRNAGLARPRSEIVDVIVLAGKRDRLIRVRTVKALLRLERRPPPGIRLRVLCPKENQFHAKAYLFQGKRTHIAVVGSFNWTRPGLDGRGECWATLRGRAVVKSFYRTLEQFENSSVPWATEIKRYREARLRGRGPKGPVPPAPIGTARTIEDLEPLSERSIRAVDRLIKRKGLKRLRPRIPLGRYVLLSGGTFHEFEEQYPVDAWFDSGWHDEGWKRDARRELAKVAYVLPYPSGGILIFRRQVLDYRVTPRLATAAKGFRIRQTRYPPSQRSMRQYLDLVKKTRDGRRKKRRA